MIWLRILFKPAGLVGGLVRVGSLLAFLTSVGISVFRLDQRLWFSVLWGSHSTATSVGFGYILAVFIAVMYAMISAGIAFEKSRGPTIKGGELLEPDQEHRVMRLSVHHYGGPRVRLSANLVSLRSDDGQVHPILPIPLGWMHGANEISEGEERKVDVVYFDGTDAIFGTNTSPGNRGYYRHITVRPLRRAPLGADFCIEVRPEEGTEMVRREFRLVPDDTQPFGLRAVLMP